MNHIVTGLKMLLIMIILTGLIYPTLLTLIAQIAMPTQANGNLVRSDKQILGSALISQNFKNKAYFWSRPSAIDYDPMKPSGGSN